MDPFQSRKSSALESSTKLLVSIVLAGVAVKAAFALKSRDMGECGSRNGEHVLLPSHSINELVVQLGGNGDHLFIGCRWHSDGVIELASLEGLHRNRLP
jgi:hypothetical protein